MTEAEWRTSTDPLAMYQLLHESTALIRTRWQGWMSGRRFRFSVRKETLFRCAVCEPLLEIVASDAARSLLTLTRQQQFLAASSREVEADWHRAYLVWVAAYSADHPREQQSAWDALNCLNGQAGHHHGDWLLAAAEAHTNFKAPHGDLWQRSAIFTAERVRQAHLLHEFVGDPFRQPRLPADWQRWDAGLIATLAERIDREEDLAALPILGDSLEDAGCTDTEILAHCRHPGPHQRGCWVLDLLLGRE
jgi:hypothetical protein